MAREKVDELKQKKQELERELDKIQGELDSSIDRVREDVSSSLDPQNIIRKYPLPLVGASALLGFLIGHKNKGSSGNSADSHLSGALLAELKRLATRKAISFASDYVEELLDKKAEEHLTNNNGESASS
ncbi:MAG: hypothetical protein ACQEST_12125 [Bacteroidota bacterium]